MRKDAQGGERIQAVCRVENDGSLPKMEETAKMPCMDDRIMARLRARGRGRWVCTPADFLDLGSRPAVHQALSRLATSGALRRVGRGFYDLPRFSGILGRPAPADMDNILAALARRDGIRILPDGLAAANLLGLTAAVPARAVLATDGTTRDVRIGGRTVRLRHAGPRVTVWAGRPAASVVQALFWLGPQAAADPRVAARLRRKLPAAVKKDLLRNSDDLPGWAVPVVRALAGPLQMDR